MDSCQWDTNGDLVFYQGDYGIIRPIRVDVLNGTFKAEEDWNDPRSLLAWHQSDSRPPDFVGVNQNSIVGRWRQHEVICIDPNTGQLLWRHPHSDDSIGRLFTEQNRLGERFVVGMLDRFDIVSVSTGETRSIRPADVGLNEVPMIRPSPADVEAIPAKMSVFASARLDRLKDNLLLATPLLPLVVWLIWRFIQFLITTRSDRRSTAR
jgi:hypothetical protein